jgi:hypothetical protein
MGETLPKGDYMQQEYFSDPVCSELGNYVYRLIDPRNGETFYVGKGKGNRVFSHVSAALELADNEDETSAKIGRIHEIRRSGLEVIHVIHRHGIPDASVYEVEAALIDAYSGLSNIAGGHGSNDRGPMHARQIIDKYDLPKISWEPEHKLVLINVNKFESSGKIELYQQVRFAWRINRSRAENADYILAVVRGVVLGAFEADYWKPVTKQNFPEVQFEEPARHGFSGGPAPESIWELYCGKRGKRIARDELRHVQNPIRYWKV